MAQVFAANGGNAGNQEPLLALGMPAKRITWEQQLIRGNDPVIRLHGGRLTRIRPANDLLDLEHGSVLDDLLHSRHIVDAGKLHENLVLPKTVLLNRGLAHAE